jgi:hypothetical protein
MSRKLLENVLEKGRVIFLRKKWKISAQMTA